MHVCNNDASWTATPRLCGDDRSNRRLDGANNSAVVGTTGLGLSHLERDYLVSVLSDTSCRRPSQDDLKSGDAVGHTNRTRRPLIRRTRSWRDIDSICLYAVY